APWFNASPTSPTAPALAPEVNLRTSVTLPVHLPTARVRPPAAMAPTTVRHAAIITATGSSFIDCGVGAPASKDLVASNVMGKSAQKVVIVMLENAVRSDVLANAYM